MIARQTIYDTHLAGVSRSFAACIAQLQQPLRAWVALSYLLCRVADTLEDAPWACSARQRHSFLTFDRAVRHGVSEAVLAPWRAALPAGVPAGEARLLDDAGLLFADLHALPARVRRALQQTLLCMSFGMRRFMQQKARVGRLVLSDLAEVNRYCFIVAGVVGTLLTQLFSLTQPGFLPSPALANDAVHFGLLLQKVNLLKDQSGDESEGRFLVPNRIQLLHSLRPHALRAGRYLLRLPPAALPFRRFCGWSLFLAAGSLPVIAERPGSKLPRTATEALFDRVSELCRSNVALRGGLRMALSALPAPGAAVPHTEYAATARWLRRLPGQKRQRALAGALL